MMNEHPTVRGTSGVSEAFPFRPYVYAGTEPFTPRPDLPRCSVGGCVSGVEARSLCSRHYRQSRKERGDATDGV